MYTAVGPALTIRSHRYHCRL